MSFQNTISGKEFCRRNCGNVSKEKFYEEYYRIIHTAYLRSNGEPCINIIRNDFTDCFGSDLDDISVSYIYATTKYLVYDVIVASLLGDGKLDSQYYYNKLAIDIGFDVWLIKSIEEGVRLTMGDFAAFQPLAKSERLERQINDFWHFKLPKSHNFGHLYQGIAPYKRHIFETYLKLLEANRDYDNNRKQLETVIAYLKESLDIKEEKSAEVREETSAADPLTDELAKEVREEASAADPLTDELAKEVREEASAADPLTDELAKEVRDEEVKDIEDIFVFEDLTDGSEEDIKEISEEKPEINEELSTEIKTDTEAEPAAETEPETADPFESDTKAKMQGPDSVQAVNVTVNASPNKIKVHGFKDGGFKITKNKVVTAAVCLALAGTLVVPLAIAIGKGKKRK